MRVLLDSSVLLEHYTGRRPELYEALVAHPSAELCVTSEVASEYYYKFIGFAGGKSPRAVEQSGKIAEVFDDPDRVRLSEFFAVLPDSQAALKTAERLIGQYNLLPNDALILAVCLEHEVEYLASLDGDFVSACQAEGVGLVDDEKKVRAIV